MKIAVDSREKPRAIVQILQCFDEYGIKHFVNKLPVGDYMDFDNPKISIDRKQTLGEVAKNLAQDHIRFRNELLLALDLQIRLVFLVEHGCNIKTLDDVQTWKNPRLKTSPYALDGKAIYKRMKSIEQKYSTSFVFCTKSETGTRIIQLLSQNIPDLEIERR